VCAGWPERGLGLALKAEDGHARPLGPAMMAVTEQLGVWSETEWTRLAAVRRPVLRNVAGLEVGMIEAEVRQLTPLAT
jgi:L-asparaginase II